MLMPYDGNVNITVASSTATETQYLEYMVFADGTVDTETAYNSGGWTSDLDSLKIENIGTAQGAYMLGRVICSSFNAG